ncbi:hypothetical protein MSMTP_1865 [Methanosarcina sp. MTP4]|uniref:RAD55 family ATPase n=1 Tax=Methanosarcina sp. MTP4 TaxID=1434100 RepID=UPI0006154851|nr:RAD55 family ATPase [Methanosarcina sp. MTP4]AKB25334.1 hypothetical protein MSMTP_1865 [Methanosarcina sp. MTP4]
MESLSTGIEGLDLMIDGGYPKGRSVLITGPPGSGKTILGLQFLHRSCAEGKKCVMILTRELTEDLLKQAKSLGLDLDPFVENGQLIIKNIFEEKINKIKSFSKFGKGLSTVDADILDHLSGMSPDVEVVVLDNIGVMAIDHDIKEFADKFSSISIILMKNGCTGFFVMDEDSYELTHRLTGYMVAGLIRFLVKENLSVGRTSQYIYVQKMRNKQVPVKYSLYDISSRGIEIINSIKGNY